MPTKQQLQEEIDRIRTELERFDALVNLVAEPIAKECMSCYTEATHVVATPTREIPLCDECLDHLQCFLSVFGIDMEIR